MRRGTELAKAICDSGDGTHPDSAEDAMKEIQEGQCGLCTHFGESHPSNERLIQIRTSHDGPEDLVDECGHPRHATLHLKVTPISGCDGFEPAARSA